MNRASPLIFLGALGAACSAEPSAITRDEIVEGIAKWVAEADQDGDQHLDKNEWHALMRRDFPDVSETDRVRWGDRDFGYYDTNGDGLVEPRELAALSLEGFDCHDTNADGRLSNAERDAMPSEECQTRVIGDQ